MDKPIRILCVFSELNRGGAETMCMNLYRHINRNIIQFDFIKHTTTKGAFENEIISLGGKIYTAPKYNIINQISYCNWWKNHLKKHPEHLIIHGHFFTISSVYFKVAKKMNRVTIGHSHTTNQLTVDLKTFIKKQIQNRTEKYSDYAFACSKAAGDWLFKNKKYIILNNAIDASKFIYDIKTRNSIKSDLNLSNNFVIGTVGSIKDIKNPFETIEIFKALYKKNNNVRLLWVGNGPLLEAVKEKLKKEHLYDLVTFTGERSDIHKLLQAMDVFIFPSLWEGLGMVAIEAQAAGLPCICSTNVPQEAAITSLCEFLPLNAPQKWAEKILSINTVRQNTFDDIKQAGYDIHSTASWIQDFYVNIEHKRRCQN